MCENTGVYGDQRFLSPTRAGLIGGHELPHLGAGTPNSGLLQEKEALLILLSLQPPRVALGTYRQGLGDPVSEVICITVKEWVPTTLWH